VMIWPPTFPALKDDPARFAFWSLEDQYRALVRFKTCCTVHHRSHCFVIAM
jgi:hypothetical protein